MRDDDAPRGGSEQPPAPRTRAGAAGSIAPMAARSQAPLSRPSRRAFGRAVLGAGLTAGALAAPALGQGARPRVVVVGGGAAGATVARYVAKDDSGLDVTLINAQPFYTTPFFGNLYLVGYRSLQSITHRYDLLVERHGVRFIADSAVAVDRDAKTVRLGSGPSAPYDRLVLAPGVGFRPDAIEGYAATAQEQMPHGWAGGFQSFLLRRRLEEMPRGGVFAISAPPNPYRAPSAPYERAAMAALLLQRINPRAKVLVFDAKDAFPQQALFQRYWTELYGDMIEWSPASFTGGGVVRVDAREGAVTLGDGQSIQVDAANIIPPQQAGSIVAQAGLVDAGGWAPIDPATLRSAIDPSIYLLGDACRAGAMPKTAFAANSQAHVAALAIRSDLSGARLFPPRYRNVNWNYVGAKVAIKTGASYRVVDGEIRPEAEFESAEDETPRQLLDSALEANSWYAGITADMFA